MSIHIKVNLKTQAMHVFDKGNEIKTYAISSAKNGIGEKKNSFQTPRGKHIIRAKIGHDMPANTVFVDRRPTGEVYSDELWKKHPNRDRILTRIMWLSGTEVGKNRRGDVDTMQRYIYIHGAPDCAEMGKPGSHGCLRMHNHDIVELFDLVTAYTPIEIFE